MEKVSRGEIIWEKTRGLEDGLTHNFISLHLEPEYKQTVANSKLESLCSNANSEVWFCKAEDLGMLCFLSAPTEAMATTSLWMNSLVCIFPKPQGQWMTKSVDLRVWYSLVYKSSSSYYSVLSHLMEVVRGLLFFWMQNPDISVLTERGLDHLSICPLPDLFCTYNSLIPHLPLPIRQDCWIYAPFKNTSVFLISG